MNDDVQNDDNNTEEESFAELFESYSAGMSQDIQVGDKITGRIISIGKDTVFLDTGTKIDGAADKTEFLDEDGNFPYQLGDTLELYATRVSESEILLSKAISGVGGLNMLLEAYDGQIPIEGKVSATCKGGFSVEILQRRTFCPISQMDITYVETPETYVGQRYSFLITQFEEKGRNIVVSRRKLLEQERDVLQEEVYQNLTVGSEWDATVRRIMPFGVFVDISNGVEGMVHVSELSWSRVESPQEVVQEGDILHVKVIGLKAEEGKKRPKISLSVKQAQGDPWDNFQDKFAVGDVVTGKVTRCARFGAFVEIHPGVEGLVHISEMSYEKRVMNPEEIVSPKEKVSVLIKDMDLAKRRITLSLKEAKGDPWASFLDTHAAGQSVSGTFEKKENFGLFVKLAPGVVGLLPKSKMNQSQDRASLENLKPGDPLTVIIEEIKPAERKVSLSPGDSADEAGWQRHVQTDTGGGLGALGEKLKQALKDQGDK